HIGSAPGDAGLSGTQVKPFVPARSTRMRRPGSITAIVALAPIAAGAADSALFIAARSEAVHMPLIGFAIAWGASRIPSTAIGMRIMARLLGPRELSTSQTAISAITGTWSEAFCQPRILRTIVWLF